MGSKHSVEKGPEKVSYPVPNYVDPSSVQTDCIEKVKVIWTLKSTLLFQKLSFNIVREVCQYIGYRDQFPLAIFHREIRYFDIETEQWRPFCSLKQEICVNKMSASVLLRDSQVFVCGGHQRYRKKHPANSAYILKKDGIVRILPHMSTHRKSPGVVYDPNSFAVYVFGGHGLRVIKELRSAEKFLLASSKWSNLPDMHEGRCWFNPCIYASVIYLFGGRAKSVETYDIESGHFRLLTNFPIEANHSCSAAICGDTLVVISEPFTYRWNLTTNQYSLFRRSATGVRGDWSRCTPVVRDNLVYIVDAYYQCIGCNLVTGDTETRVDQGNSKFQLNPDTGKLELARPARVSGAVHYIRNKATRGLEMLQGNEGVMYGVNDVTGKVEVIPPSILS